MLGCSSSVCCGTCFQRVTKTCPSSALQPRWTGLEQTSSGTVWSCCDTRHLPTPAAPLEALLFFGARKAIFAATPREVTQNSSV